MSYPNIVPGHRIHGSGVRKVVMLHDWMSDGTSYDTTLPYLDPALG
jgi:hypothetical protein